MTAKGKVWFQEAGLILKTKLTLRKPIEEDVELDVDLDTTRHQDLDNIAKAACDVLTKSGVIEEDSQIVGLVFHKYKVKTLKEERLEIELCGY